MNSSNALDPQSPQARAIYDLGIVSSIVFLLIFVVVAGTIVYAILRFRARAGEARPEADRREQEGGDRLDGYSVPDRHLPLCDHP